MGKLESALYSDLLMSNSKTFSITGFAVLLDQHSVFFVGKTEKYSVYLVMWRETNSTSSHGQDTSISLSTDLVLTGAQHLLTIRVKAMGRII